MINTINIIIIIIIILVVFIGPGSLSHLCLVKEDFRRLPPTIEVLVGEGQRGRVSGALPLYGCKHGGALRPHS